MSELDKIKSRLKNLKQNKNKSEEDILKLAKEEYDKQSILDSLSFCVNDEEKTWAKTLLEKYLSEASFENFSERDTLKSLIDNEILTERIKKLLAQEYNKANPSIPMDLVDQLRDLTTQSLSLKEKLGLISKEQQLQDWQIFWNDMRKKVFKYAETHSAEFIHKCPHCQKFFRYLLRVKEYEAQKIPYFKDTTVYNERVFQLYEDKKITMEDAATILGVSPMYISMMRDEIFLKEKKENDK